MSCQAGKINLIERLNNEIAALYMSEQCSDITLYIEGQNIPAHRSIIGARCEYLKTYFSNGLNEPNQTKFVLNVPLEAFQVLLKYFYSGQINLTKITNVETLIQILNLVEEYCLFYLKTHFEIYLIEIITVENTFQLLEVAKTYELKELEIKSLKFIDTNADQILASKSFKKIQRDLLEDILTRDTFIPSELSIFHAVEKWSKHANQNIETVIHLVKLPLIPLDELLRIGKSGKLTGERIFDAIEIQMTAKSSLRSAIQSFEQLPEQNENVVSPKYNVRTLQGGVKNDDDIKYRHTIGDGSSITIELGQIFIINHLKMELVGVFYGYFIEISTDQQKWERIIHYSLYKCHSMQNLYFPPEPVKYVKIVGIRSPHKVFEVGTFEAYYKENIPKIRNGILVPKEKVDYEISYMNAGSYIICLTQPFNIGSIRFYLDNQNSNRKYKFYIQTSLNERDWERVAHKRNEFVNGWQNFRFTSKPISFIRIIPTDCNIDSVLDWFRVENFECPSSVYKW